MRHTQYILDWDNASLRSLCQCTLLCAVYPHMKMWKQIVSANQHRYSIGSLAACITPLKGQVLPSLPCPPFECKSDCLSCATA